MADDTPTPEIKHEMRTKTIPEDGTYRIDKVEDGRLIVTVNDNEYDADPSAVNTVVGLGQFVQVKFEGKIAKIVAVI